jgi:hypothetical protein
MKHANSKIDVKNKAGKTISIRLDAQTAISRDNKKVTASELRVGQSLVVDAYGDTEDDSLALEIRIVPPIRAGRRHAVPSSPAVGRRCRNSVAASRRSLRARGHGPRRRIRPVDRRRGRFSTSAPSTWSPATTIWRSSSASSSSSTV